MIWPPIKTPAEAAPFRLDTERLQLRPAVQNDYAQWAEVRGRNRSFLKPYEPSWPEGCLERGFFRRRVERLDDDWKADRTYAFLITDRAAGTLLGGINLNNVARGAAQYASLGYWLDERAQGRGYMSEAAGAIAGFAFGRIALSRLNAATLPDNHKSQAMLVRTGFVREGFAKAFIQIDGQRRDHILFGLNADDFSGAA